MAELAPAEAIASNDGWSAHALATRDLPEATHDDLEWADAIVFGTPTRYGLPTAQLKQFIDATGPLWARGALANKVISSFTSAGTGHGGHESTILAVNNVAYHWGGINVPPGYLDPIQFQTGNPSGASYTSNNGATPPDDDALASANSRGDGSSPRPRYRHESGDRRTMPHQNDAEPFRVLAIPGSLRRGSYNRRLIVAARDAAPAGVRVELFDLRPIPVYDGDVEAAGDPPAVADFKARIRAADALLIATLEYNGTVPGVLQNAIDWASRPRAAAALDGKPVAVVGASPGPGGDGPRPAGAAPDADQRRRPGAGAARAARAARRRPLRRRDAAGRRLGRRPAPAACGPGRGRP